MKTLLPQIHMRFESLESCPVCGSSSMKVADAQYNVCICSCGYVCDNPRPTSESISEFYSAKGKYASWVAKEESYNRLWRRRLKRILKDAKPGSILDIGAGTGQFLSIAKPYFTSIYGSEVSSSGAAVAKEKYGIALTVGDIHSISLELASFDNITLFHVLEHVHNPVAMLRRVWELLKEDGMLFVCVPNDVFAWGSHLKAFGKRLGLPRFQKFSPIFGMPMVGTSSEIHLSHFTESSLSRTVNEAGFIICRVGLDPYFAASWPATSLHAFYLSFHTLLYRTTGTNFYETIMLVAKKSRA